MKKIFFAANAAQKHKKNFLNHLVGSGKVYTCPVTGTKHRVEDMVFVSIAGLGALVESAIADFEEKVGESVFPYNFVWSGRSGILQIGPAYYHNPGWETYRGRYCSPEGAEEIVSWYKRFAGWIRTAAELPALRKVLVRGMSPNGVNSPYTEVYPDWMFKRFPSPHKLEKLLWATRERAEGILKRWGNGYHPSWVDIYHFLEKTERVGKAAIIAVAKTLTSRKYFRFYRDARDFLTQLAIARREWVKDTSDGVEILRSPEPVYTKLGISVYRALYQTRYGKYYFGSTAISKSGETYHHAYADHPESVLRDAIRSWKRRRELESQNREIVDFVNGARGYCPLVTVEDSYAAGNCVPGTQAWMREHGFVGDIFPAKALLPYIENNLVLNVLKQVRERSVRVEKKLFPINQLRLVG